MPIEFFRNEMMNKLFIPMVATGSVALTAGVVTTVNWSSVGSTVTSIDIPDISLPEFGGSDSGDNTSSNDSTDTSGSDVEDSEDVETVGPSNPDSNSSRGGFNEDDYSSMGGLDYGDITDEEIGYITTDTTSIVRCGANGNENAFMEFGFNDNNDEWTYLIAPQSGAALLLSKYSYYEEGADGNFATGFRFLSSNFGYTNYAGGAFIWQDELAADTSEYGNNDGIVTWLEWRQYMVDEKAITQGFGDCSVLQVS